MADWGAFLEGALGGAEKGLMTTVDIKKILAEQKRSESYLNLATAQTAEGIKTGREARLKGKFDRVAKLYEVWKSGQPVDVSTMSGHELEAYERAKAIKEGRPTKRVQVEQTFDVPAQALETRKDKQLMLKIAESQRKMVDRVEEPWGMILKNKASDIVTPMAASNNMKELDESFAIATQKLEYLQKGIATNESGEPILDEKGQPVKETLTGIKEGYFKEIGLLLENYYDAQEMLIDSREASGMREEKFQDILNRFIKAWDEQE
jgi:hypothetical protein